ncbi:hypothetical protein CR513_56640, partial [Mucuna pruriens]
SSTDRVRVKGNILLKNFDPLRARLRVKIAINQIQNTEHHRSNNNNNKECHHKATHHLWRT